MAFVYSLFVFIALATNVHSTFMSQQCLDCICYASTGCDQSKQCHNFGEGAYFCGPFQISWAYWSDAGKPGDTGNPQDFEKCLNNKQCAEQTVVGYMRRWKIDCNNDGVIDCIDYAAIHKGGPNQCTSIILHNSEYWKRFQSTKCYSTHGSAVISSGHPRPVGTNFQPDRSSYPYEVVSGVVVSHEPSFVRVPNGGGYPDIVRVSNEGTVTGSGRIPARPISWTVYPSTNVSAAHRPIQINPGNVISSSVITATVKPVSRPSNPNPSNSLFINGEEPVSDNCLSCICEACSGCDLSKQCEGEFCGAYLISWAYWSDGGKPGGDYISCALNKKCAERAIQGYMSKWLTDCNGDGVIDCDDFAAIHKLGAQACKTTSIANTKYWKSYSSCSNPAIDPREPATRRVISYNPPEIQPQPQPRLPPQVQPRPPPQVQPRQPPRVQPRPPPQVQPRQPSRVQPRPQPQPTRPNHPSNVYIEVNNRRPPTNPYFPNLHEIDIPAVPNGNGYNVEEPQPVFDPSDYRRPEHELSTKPSVTRPAPTRAVDVPVIRSPPPPRPVPDPRLPPSTYVEPIDDVPSSPSQRGSRTNVNTNVNRVIPSDCMACICEASSRCDENILCSNDIATKVCGPYQISFTYWTDAGRPGYRGSGGDFENCANEKGCAENCVQSYVNKWAIDCNGDGVIDCLDYAAIHKAGPKQCNDRQFLQSHYWNEFQTCVGFNKK